VPEIPRRYGAKSRWDGLYRTSSPSFCTPIANTVLPSLLMEGAAKVKGPTVSRNGVSGPFPSQSRRSRRAHRSVRPSWVAWEERMKSAAIRSDLPEGFLVLLSVARRRDGEPHHLATRRPAGILGESPGRR
jgi:hypothetical protein